MSTPELKEIWDLSSADFERNPVWVGVHNFDVGEPWHTASNDCAYRPWNQMLPAKAEAGRILVGAVFELRSGDCHPGFFTAVPESWDVPPRPGLSSISSRYGGPELGLVGVQQPRIFLGHQQFSFWGGRSGMPLEKRQTFYNLLGKPPENIFPIRFLADSALAMGILMGEVKGFYKVISKQPFQIEW
jgi:hypothetical protein